MAGLPYQQNEELMAMKEDIADRKFRVKMIGMAVTGLLLVGALATAFMVPAAAGLLGSGLGKLLLPLAAAVTSFVTLKEVKRLEMDEKYLQTYMQAKNHWGEGYREEVAEKGYGFGRSPSFPEGAPPPPELERER